MVGEKDKKPRINSRTKGSEYELRISKILAEWYQEDFHRVPSSGGLRWGKDNRVSGDIIAQEGSTFPFSIECKKREDWTFEQLLKGVGEVESWWAQCIRDASNVDKKPLLIFSKNRSPNYYMMSFDDYSLLVHVSGPMSVFVYQQIDRPTRIIGILSDLINTVSKGDVIKAYQLQRRVEI